MMHVRRSWSIPSVTLGLCLSTSACQLLHVYDGDKRSDDELARIVGDTRLSGSLPVTITIRRVDDEEIGIPFRGAYVLPGEHDLLIDCTVTESKHTSRHHLHVDVDAGVKYGLVADTGPGNRSCVDVQIVTR